MMRSAAHAFPHGGGRGALPGRDRQVVELVGRFRLMTAEQIRSVIFTTQASKTPLDRALGRLTAAGYLARLGRLVGGVGGGSGQYVYQLGRLGWRLLGKGGGYRPIRVVDLHTLTIAECFVLLRDLEQRDQLTLISYLPEPGCHRIVGTTPLTPDAYVELGIRERNLKFCYWLEVDRGTEHADTIQGKCVRYWRAYQAWDGDTFPYVAFVVPDAGRKREIEKVITGGPVEGQSLFQVSLLESFAEDIHRNMR
jgi:hypothetical protein